MLVVIDYNDNTTSFYGKHFDDTYLINSKDDEINLYSDLNNVYLEDKDNSDDYEPDDEEFCEWISCEMPRYPEICRKYNICNDSSISLEYFLQGFKCYYDVVVIYGGKAKLCI